MPGDEGQQLHVLVANGSAEHPGMVPGPGAEYPQYPESSNFQNFEN